MRLRNLLTQVDLVNVEMMLKDKLKEQYYISNIKE